MMTGEKPLEKMTVKELKEIALAIEGVQGVSAMKKEELLKTIKIARGIPLKKTREVSIASITDLKKKMALLRANKGELRERGESKAVSRLRKRINRLKKRTRKLARNVA